MTPNPRSKHLKFARSSGPADKTATARDAVRRPGHNLHRLRETIERSLGALLVSRRVRANPKLCPQLAVILADWDGQFTVLVRKRVARHIESCTRCDQDRRRLVSPAALLGAAPILVPAPAWLRRRTLDKIRLTCAETDLSISNPHSRSGRDAPGPGSLRDPDVTTGRRRRFALLTTLLIGVPLVVLGETITRISQPQRSVAPISATSEIVTPRSAVAPPPAPVRPTTRPTAPPRTRPQTRTAVPAPEMPRTTVTSTVVPEPSPPDMGASPPPPLPPPPPVVAPVPRITITFAPPRALVPPLQIPSPLPQIFPRPAPRESASTPAQQPAPPPAPAQAPSAADVPPPPASAPPTSVAPVPANPYPIIR